MINICKGGQSEDDLLSKPFVRIDYYGPGEEMSGGLKDWYSQTEDLAPLQCGPYTWEGFTTTDYDLMAVLCAEDGEHQYQASIYLEVDGQSISLEDEDVQAILASVAPAGSTPAGNTGASGGGPTSETAGEYGWWAGNWYGWWAIKNGSGIYQDPSDKGLVWDMDKGVAHFPSTSAWAGNVGFSAHNINFDGSDGYFKDLHKLSEGDTIRYQTSLGERSYTVESVREIDASDWSPLGYTDDDRLTLITCISGKSEKRFCVQAVA